MQRFTEIPLARELYEPASDNGSHYSTEKAVDLNNVCSTLIEVLNELEFSLMSYTPNENYITLTFLKWDEYRILYELQVFQIDGAIYIGDGSDHSRFPFTTGVNISENIKKLLDIK